ncbi:MAG: hypothetical protein A2W80_18440 [Candidatus Riflebacteria bacterium GWC2_50_8]|nr:MAG: hypothetical protein A2W80_18440 [Candidatus Riflebacteria bacterium GWC2_50_8]
MRVYQINRTLISLCCSRFFSSFFVGAIVHQCVVKKATAASLSIRSGLELYFTKISEKNLKTDDNLTFLC